MSLTTLPAVLAAYPEKTPFDWVPLLHNLVPRDKARDVPKDTPEFVAAALAQAKATGINPLYMWYGTNPLTVFEEELEDMDVPITAYARPPPLPEADLSLGVTVIEQIHIEGSVPVFKIQIGDDTRIMKVFLDMDRDEIMNDDPETWGMDMVRFRREKEAYAHLRHFGACEKGAVPMCYGWAALPRPLAAEISDRYGNTDWGSSQLLQDIAGMKRHRRCAKAIVLEYVADAAPLSVSNATATLAQTVLRTLTAVHRCYVRQNDVSGDNILVLKDNRVVVVDFDDARCVSLEDPGAVRRQDLLRELAEIWAFFYGELLPDKRIGFQHWLY